MNVYGYMAEVFVWLHNLGLKTVCKYLRMLPLNVFQTLQCISLWLGWFTLGCEEAFSKRTVSLQTGVGVSEEEVGKAGYYAEST